MLLEVTKETSGKKWVKKHFRVKFLNHECVNLSKPVSIQHLISKKVYI